mgnify:CR=1 FL=1
MNILCLIFHLRKVSLINRINISTLFLAHALAVGSQEHSDKRNAVELLDLIMWTWETMAPYPFQNSIELGPIVNFGNKFIMFGVDRGQNCQKRSKIWVSKCRAQKKTRSLLLKIEEARLLRP